MASVQEQPASSPPTWWQRICRRLRRIMAVLWGVIIVSIASSTIANIFTTSIATPLSQLYVINWIIIYRIPLFFVAGGLLLLTAISWIGSRESKVSSSLSPDQQSRVIILKALRKAYTDELAASLQGMARIALGLHERFDLTHPTRLSSWQSRQPEQALPAGTTIVDAYDQAGNGLLILGEPGAGKSTLLYDLAQALLLRAEQGEQHLLPVILNLSSWATRRLPLQEWLVGELYLRYGIPHQLSQRWMQQAKFLPLLDGLDEVAASARNACIEAINTYHSECLVPLVVCSRREEYEAASEQLTLQSAVIVQPLTAEQVKAYLKDSGQPLAAVRQVIDTNMVLRDLVTTPLMLSVVTLTYKDKAVKDLPQLGSAEDQQHQVFDHYVSRMLEQPTRKWRYASSQTHQWLIWLAQQMKQRQLTEFYVELLQPTWLSMKRLRDSYTMLCGLVGVLVAGLAIGLVVGLLLGGGLGIALGDALLFGLLVGPYLMVRPQIQLSNKLTSWNPILQWLSGGLGRCLLTGLGCWLVSALFVLLIGLTSGGLVASYLESVGIMLVVVLVVMLVIGLRFVLPSAQIDVHTHLRPNQGIHTSGRNALRSGLLFGLVIGLVVGLVARLPNEEVKHLFTVNFVRLSGGLVNGLGVGLAGGLVSGLLFGGRAYLQHYCLRYLLWRSRAMPWHYVRFLEEATERILLQRVGGGYRFIHPLFLDYFASLNTIAPPPTIQSSSKTLS